MKPEGHRGKADSIIRHCRRLTVEQSFECARQQVSKQKVGYLIILERLTEEGVGGARYSPKDIPPGEDNAE